MNYFNGNINELLNDFATNFKEKVNKIIHKCNIHTTDNIGIVHQNSLYLD